MDSASENIQRLVDAGDLDRLLSVVSPDDIADAWWRYNLRDQGAAEAHPDVWAADLWLAGPIYEREEILRKALHALAERAPDGADLSYLGAGPIENSIIDAEDHLSWVEEEARRSTNFRKALGNVWIWDDVSPETFLRVQNAAGVELAWPSLKGPRPSG